jgi:hypothetical protein
VHARPVLIMLQHDAPSFAPANSMPQRLPHSTRVSTACTYRSNSGFSSLTGSIASDDFQVLCKPAKHRLWLHMNRHSLASHVLFAGCWDLLGAISACPTASLPPLPNMLLKVCLASHIALWTCAQVLIPLDEGERLLSLQLALKCADIGVRMGVH